MVLELGPPLFGEPEAGREWQMTLEADLTELGWVPAENVPCMWRLDTGNNDCLLGIVVDDLFFSEKNGHAIADATCEALRKKYIGVTSEHNPKAFAGYNIEQSPERDVITISMPELIGQKFAQECPELNTANVGPLGMRVTGLTEPYLGTGTRGELRRDTGGFLGGELRLVVTLLSLNPLLATPGAQWSRCLQGRP